jgi:hypothetical protein
MSSIKQLIINAIIKVSGENPALNREGEPTAEEVRDNFIALLMAELFPEESVEPQPQEIDIPVVEVAKKSPKKTPEEKAAAKAEKEAAKAAKAEAKAEKAATPKTSPADKAAAKEAAKAAKEAEKAAAKAAKEAEKEAAKAAKLAEKEAAKSAKKTAKVEAKVADVPALPASPKPEAQPEVKAAAKPKKAKAEKPAEGANIQKIDPTFRKHLKAGAKAVGKEATKELESELLAYLNTLDNEVFKTTKAEDHVKAFFAPAAPTTPQEEVKQVNAIDVEFQGKMYAVDPDTKRVYVKDGEVHRGVGYVGMAMFADLEIPEYDDE